MKALLLAVLLLAAAAPAWAQSHGGGGMNPAASNSTNPVPVYSKAKCDWNGSSGTDDSATIQAEITAAYASGRKIVLPAGICKVTNLSITAPVHISGHGNKQTFLLSPNGSTNSVITVNAATNNGTFPGVVQLDDMAITGQSRVDAPGVNNVHGMRLKADVSIQTEINLNNVSIGGVPGSCLYAESGEAAGIFVIANNFNCLLPGQYGVYANSTSDWVFTAGLFYGAIQSNILCSGCGFFHFNNVNNFSAQVYGLQIFNGNRIFWSGGSIDRNFQNGVQIDNATGGDVFINQFNTGYNGSLTNATYYDINIGATNTGNVYLSQVHFLNPANAPTANKVLANLNIAAGNTGTVRAYQVEYGSGGTWLTNGTVNGSRQFYKGIEPERTWTPTLIGSTSGSATLNVADGRYTVSNGVVTLWATINATAVNTAVGNYEISGLPVVPENNGANDFGMCVLNYGGWTAPAGYGSLTGLLNGNSGSFIIIEKNAIAGATAAQSAVAEWSYPAKISVNCTYRY
jgi:hypothetical protein